MNKCLGIGLFILSSFLYADDYSEGRQFALNAQINASSGFVQLNPNDYLNSYTTTPNESALNPNSLKEEALKTASKNEVAAEVMTGYRLREKAAVDANSAEMLEAGKTIDGAENHVNGANLPCTNGNCLPTDETQGDDFTEGASRLGVLAGSAKEISDKQIGSGNPSIFTGSNYKCRIAVAGIGNCCGGHARFLHCRAEEKALAVAITESRAEHVGRFCAHRKLGICYEEKESWCVFPSKLAGLIQHQGRLNQLGINFGWASGKKNRPNCRGITPEELERINFKNLDLSALSKELEARFIPKNPAKMDSEATSKIEAMERRGGAHG